MPANITDPLVRGFQPDNPDVVIWRYMNLKQFVALVESNKLSFTSLDQYPDQFEGHNTLAGKIASNISSDSAGLAVWSDDLVNTFIRESSYVNCWTEGPAESAAFWEIKGAKGIAVAIRSTYNKLRNVLPDNYVIGQVKYINYNLSPGFVVSGSDSEFPFFEHVYHKRLEYCYENEIRAARIPRFGSIPNASNADVCISNLSGFIDTVYIRRSDHHKTKKRVKNLCNKHKLNYGESRINDQPIQIRLSEQQRKKLMKRIAAANVPKGASSKMLQAIVIIRALKEALDL